MSSFGFGAKSAAGAAAAATAPAAGGFGAKAPAADGDGAKAPAAPGGGFGGGGGAASGGFGKAAAPAGDAAKAPGGFGGGAGAASGGFGGGGFGGSSSGGAAASSSGATANTGFGATSTASAAGTSGATAAAAPTAPVVQHFPLDVATVHAALGARAIDRAFSDQVQQHVAAPMKKRSGAAAGGAAPAFDAAQYQRSHNDLSCLFQLFAAEMHDASLHELLATIAPKVVSNVATYLATPPPKPATTGRLALNSTASAHETQDAELSIGAAELVLTITERWQLTDAALKDILAALQERLRTIAAEAASGGGTGGPSGALRAAFGTPNATSPSSLHLHSVYLLILSLTNALTTTRPLQRAKAPFVGMNELAGNKAPLARNLIEWLDRQQKELMPTPAAGGGNDNSSSTVGSSSLGSLGGGFASAANLPPAAGRADKASEGPKSPLAGKLLSIAALAISAFAHGCGEEDKAFDIAFDATRSYTRPAKLGHQRTTGGSRKPARPAAAASGSDKPTGIASIAGYGKAFARLAQLLPPADALTVAVAIPARAAFRLLRHVVATMAPLVRHLANLDVESYRALGAFLDALGRRGNAVQQQQQQQQQQPYYGRAAAIPADGADEPLKPVVTSFHLPHLMDSIATLYLHLRPADLYDDDACSPDDGDASLSDDEDQQRQPSRVSNILHLLLGNLPVHLRLVVDVRRSQQQASGYLAGRGGMMGAGSGSGAWDAATAKTVGSYLRCVATVAQSHPVHAARAFQALDQQVECPELHLSSLVDQLCMAVGLPPHGNGATNSMMVAAHSYQQQQQQQQHHYDPSADARADAALATQHGASSIRQLTVSYVERQQSRLASGIASLLAALAARVGPRALERHVTLETVFDCAGGPAVSHEVLGKLLALGASLVDSADTASLALNMLDASGILRLNREDKASNNNSDRATAAGRFNGARASTVVNEHAAADANGQDIADVLEQECRIASYAVTIGFLRLANAIAEFPLPQEATPLVVFVSQRVLCGFAKRSYLKPDDQYIVGAMSCALLYRTLSPAKWADGAVPYHAILAPTRAPSDVVGDCIEVISTAADDTHHRRSVMCNETRLVCLREALRLLTAAVVPAAPPTSAAATGLASSAAHDLGSGDLGTSERAHSILLDGSFGGRTSFGRSGSGHTVSFGARARTYESPSFIGDLLRLACVDDAMCASSALELAAALLPASTGAVVRDLAKQSHASAAACERMASIVLPSSNRDYMPLSIPATLAGVAGLDGNFETTAAAIRRRARDHQRVLDGSNGSPSRHDGGALGDAGVELRAEQRAAGGSDDDDPIAVEMEEREALWATFVESEQDRLRRAVVDVALKGASSHTPELTMWLCGYPSTGAGGTPYPAGLPSWIRRGLAANDGHSQHHAHSQAAPMRQHCLLEALLDALNHEGFCDAKPLLVARYTKLLACLLSNPSTNTPVLQRALAGRDGIHFVNSVYTSLCADDAGLDAHDATAGAFDTTDAAEHNGSLLGLGRSGWIPPTPEVVFRHAFTTKLLVLELFNAAAAASSSPHRQQQQQNGGLSPFVNEHLRALLQPTRLPAAHRIARDIGTTNVPTIGAWLIAALHSAPRMPSLASYGTASGAFALVMPPAAAAAAAAAAAHGSAAMPDPIAPGSAEELAPFYDVAAIYRRVRDEEQFKAPERRATRQDVSDLLHAFAEANRVMQAHVMVAGFVSVWGQLIELIAACFGGALSIDHHVSLMILLLNLAERVATSRTLAQAACNSVCETISSAVAALARSLHTALVRHVEGGAADALTDPYGAGTPGRTTAAAFFGAASAAGLAGETAATMIKRVLGALQLPVLHGIPAAANNLYAAALSLVVLVDRVRIDIDADRLLQSINQLFHGKLLSDATRHPVRETRIVALRLMQRLTIRFPSAAGTLLRRPSALREFTDAALASLDEAVVEVFATESVDLASTVASWAEALCGALGAFAAIDAAALANTGIVGRVAALRCWAPLSTAVISDAENSASILRDGAPVGAAAGALLGGVGPDSFPASAAPVVLASRTYLAVLDVLCTLCGKLDRHTTVPVEASDFVSYNMAVFARVLAPAYAAASAKLAVATPQQTPLSSPVMIPVRLMTAAAHLLLHLSNSNVVLRMAPVCAKLQLPECYRQLIDTVAEVVTQATTHRQQHGGGGNNQTLADAEAAAPEPHVTGFLRYAYATLGCVATTMLNVVSPAAAILEAENVDPTNANSASPPIAGAPLDDLSPSGNGRRAIVAALESHTRLVQDIARAVVRDEIADAAATDSGNNNATSRMPGAPDGADRPDDGHSLAVAVRSAQIAAVLLHTDLIRRRSDPLDPHARDAVVKAAGLLRAASIEGSHSAAARNVTQRSQQGVSAQAQAAAAAAAHDVQVFRSAAATAAGEFLRDAVPMGHHAVGSAADAATNSAQALEVVLEALVRSAQQMGAAGSPWNVHQHDGAADGSTSMRVL